MRSIDAFDLPPKKRALQAFDKSLLAGLHPL